MAFPFHGLGVRAAIGIAAALALASCSGAPATKQAASHAASAKTITEPANAGTLARMRIISSEQYLNTVAYIFGNDMRMDTHFAPLRRTEGLLESGAAFAGLDRKSTRLNSSH